MFRLWSGLGRVYGARSRQAAREGGAGAASRTPALRHLLRSPASRFRALDPAASPRQIKPQLASLQVPQVFFCTSLPKSSSLHAGVGSPRSIKFVFRGLSGARWLRASFLSRYIRKTSWLLITGSCELENRGSLFPSCSTGNQC